MHSIRKDGKEKLVYSDINILFLESGVFSDLINKNIKFNKKPEVFVSKPDRSFDISTLHIDVVKQIDRVISNFESKTKNKTRMTNVSSSSVSDFVEIRDPITKGPMGSRFGIESLPEFELVETRLDFNVSPDFDILLKPTMLDESDFVSIMDSNIKVYNAKAKTKKTSSKKTKKKSSKTTKKTKSSKSNTSFSEKLSRVDEPVDIEKTKQEIEQKKKELAEAERMAKQKEKELKEKQKEEEKNKKQREKQKKLEAKKKMKEQKNREKELKKQRMLEAKEKQREEKKKEKLRLIEEKKRKEQEVKALMLKKQREKLALEKQKLEEKKQKERQAEQEKIRHQKELEEKKKELELKKQREIKAKEELQKKKEKEKQKKLEMEQRAKEALEKEKELVKKQKIKTKKQEKPVFGFLNKKTEKAEETKKETTVETPQVMHTFDKKSSDGTMLDPDVKKVLQITDDLLGNLPDEVIEDFAKSKDFKVYEKVMNKYMKK